MTNGSSQDQDMPYCMMIYKPPPDVEDDAHTKKDGSGNDEPDHCGWHISKEGIPPGEQHPTHSQVNNSGYDFEPATIEGFKDCSSYRQNPDYHEEGEAKIIIDEDEDEGGIRTGNEKINTDVIEDLK
jgi:hypothetical protein